jgi:hypothetical protein
VGAVSVALVAAAVRLAAAAQVEVGNEL